MSVKQERINRIKTLLDKYSKEKNYFKVDQLKKLLKQAKRVKYS